MDLTPDPYRELIVRTAKARWHLDEIAALRARAVEILAAQSRDMQASLHALKHNLPRPRWTITHHEADRAAYLCLLLPRLEHLSELLVARDCNEALGKSSPYWNKASRMEDANEAEFHKLFAQVLPVEAGNQSAGIANRKSAIGRRTGEQEPEAQARACVQHAGTAQTKTSNRRMEKRAVSSVEASAKADLPTMSAPHAPALSSSNGPAHSTRSWQDLSQSNGPTKHRNTKHTQTNRDKPTRVRHQKERRHQTHRPWSINQRLHLEQFRGWCSAGVSSAQGARLWHAPAVAWPGRPRPVQAGGLRYAFTETGPGALQTKHATKTRANTNHAHPAKQKTGPGGACLATACGEGGRTAA